MTSASAAALALRKCESFRRYRGAELGQFLCKTSRAAIGAYAPAFPCDHNFAIRISRKGVPGASPLVILS